MKVKGGNESGLWHFYCNKHDTIGDVFSFVISDLI